MTLFCLLIEPCPVPLRADPPTSRGIPLRFEAWLGDELVVTSHQPLADGARALLARGYDPDDLLTMRHANRPYASFEPAPIGDWARVTYDSVSAKRVRWKPMPDRDGSASQ